MKSNDLQQAINQLRNWEARRRYVSTTLIVGGVVLVALGGWGQHYAGQLIADAIEAFYDTPAVAIGVVSGIIPTVTITRLTMFLGLGLAGLGLAMRFYPDPRATILLALLDESDLENRSD